MAAFEVLLVTIDWESQGKFRSITPSKRYIEPSSVRDRSYDYDIVTYTKEGDFYFQFAIKTSFIPLLKDAEGKWNRSNRLFNISNDLWIIKGDWRTGQRGISYHHCPSISTVGKIEVGISEDLQKVQHFITIDINSSIAGFNFEQLKNDFEGELWNLLTSNKTQVSAERLEYRYSDKIFRFPENKSILEFVKAFDKLSKNPKKELSPSKGLRKVEKVIPIAETYRKVSVSGTSTLLPSKEVIENYDIFENRFICFMLHSINSILSKNIKYTTLQVGRLEKEIVDLDDKIVLLQDPDPQVNPINIQNEIQAQEEFYRRWLERWEVQKNTFLLQYPNTAQFFRNITFEIAYRSHYTSYWGRLFNGQGSNEYCLLEFSADCDGIFEEQKGQRVLLSAYYTLNGQAGRFNKYFVRAIAVNGIQLISITYKSIVEKQRANYNTLQANNWRQFSILTQSERNKFIQERNNQVQTLYRKKQKLELQVKTITEFIKEQSQLQPLVEERLKAPFFKSIKWRNIQGFKPSMTFIQNSHYRSALRNYKEVLASEGIDIELFDLYENVTTYGVREMPQVYELWCLVTIIKILEESYRFVPLSKHLGDLLRIINPQKQNIVEHVKIDFKNSLASRRATLHYQKRMGDDKRPDFTLEITCNRRTINLVLDSKFKNYNYKQTIIFETMAMMNKYAGSDNYIFILHPCADGIFDGRNIRYTNHGGERIYYTEGQEQQMRFPFHQYGYIEVKPNHTDTLKKLIAMSFEYLLEPSLNAKRDDRRIDPMPENPLFCMNCGGTNISINSNIRGTNRSYYNCTCSSPDCGHTIYIDYCWNCKTKLFKHGSYWDYHLESTWSIFDIRCPCCGMTIADRPPMNEL